jgi:hypothetical protein
MVVWLQYCHIISASWRNYFSQLLNVHGVNYVRQSEIHTAKRLVPQPSATDIEMASEETKRHRSPGTDQIPGELVKAVGITISSEIH